MKKLIVSTLLLVVAFTGAFAQKAGPSKITAIRIMPFDQVTGKFEDELAKDSNGGYFNDLSKSILALVEITGPPGSYDTKGKVSIRVTEGRKLKTTRVDDPGVLSETGKYYVPVFLYTSMCNRVTITATLTGQSKPSTMKRSLDFMCGE